MATNRAKPNGFLQVTHGMEKEFLAPLPVSDIPGVGDHTYEVLKSMGIFIIGQLTEAGPLYWRKGWVNGEPTCFKRAWAFIMGSVCLP